MCVYFGDRDFDILTTWDNQAVTHEPVHVQLSEDPQGCRLHVQAPFFDSPAAPSAPPGKPCPRLWDFEGRSVESQSQFRMGSGGGWMCGGYGWMRVDGESVR